MMTLWSTNHPQTFWQTEIGLSESTWQMVIDRALPILGFPDFIKDSDSILEFTLGEEQFGPDHWQLSRIKRLYYFVKPLLPRAVIDLLKSYNSRLAEGSFPLNWPSEMRYIQFQWEILKQVILLTDNAPVKIRSFWPEGKRFAFVLTHDIETQVGQAFVRNVADLEEDLGFRSSFNFVPERYPIDDALMDELRRRGFEIGVHGLKHDGKLFNSQTMFNQRVTKINNYLTKFNAVGFRSPLMHRHPEWLQALDVEYDLSFFDTDPYEPLSGGTMSIWPFILGKFVELPYTLVQDSTLFYSLGERTPQIWLEKIEFLKKYFGMALVNTHPDYLKDQAMFKIYRDFLIAIKEKNEYWHALPRDVARWWRTRSSLKQEQSDEAINYLTASLQNGDLVFDASA